LSAGGAGGGTAGGALGAAGFGGGAFGAAGAEVDGEGSGEGAADGCTDAAGAAGGGVDPELTADACEEAMVGGTAMMVPWLADNAGRPCQETGGNVVAAGAVTEEADAAVGPVGRVSMY